MRPESPHGLFFGDTRYLSGFRLFIDAQIPEVLASVPETHNTGVIVAKVTLDGGKTGGNPLMVRRRRLTENLRENIVLHNFSAERRRCHLRLELEADFAGLFDVKEGRTEPPRV